MNSKPTAVIVNKIYHLLIKELVIFDQNSSSLYV